MRRSVLQTVEKASNSTLSVLLRPGFPLVLHAFNLADNLITAPAILASPQQISIAAIENPTPSIENTF
jgi:hypothetical protein